MRDMDIVEGSGAAHEGDAHRDDRQPRPDWSPRLVALILRPREAISRFTGRLFHLPTTRPREQT